jgi:hypothetical protein
MNEEKLLIPVNMAVMFFRAKLEPNVTLSYRLISNVTTKGDQSQNVSEHNGKPILVSETFCLALNYQPKNANKYKK